MPFSEEPRTYKETRTRTSNQYVKFSPDYRITLRILDTKAQMVWKHWLPMANGGKGFGVVCANTSSQVRPCPVEHLIATLNDDDPLLSQIKARRRFIVNVLDRTPHTVCEACESTTPGKKCINCGADVSKNEFHPLNVVKIMEQGPNLFNKGLNPIEKMYQEDHGVGIDGYDLVFMTQGNGRDRQIVANPLKVEPLPEDAFLDAEGNQQKLYDLSLLAEATSVDEINMYLEGATISEVNEAKGVTSAAV